MPRSIGGGFQSIIDSDTTNLCRIIVITRLDGEVVRLAVHDKDITYDGETYKADNAASVTSILSEDGSALSGFSVRVGVNGGDIDHADLREGLYLEAEITCSIIDWSSPGVTGVDLFSGVIQDYEITETLEVEFTTTSKLLKKRSIASQKYSAVCRAVLGDSRCGVDIDALSATFTVSAVTSRRRFETDLSNGDGSWNFGIIVWTTGNNAGAAMEVRQSLNAAGEIFLFLAMARDIQIGDTGTVYPGCDKQFSTCRDTYNNLNNFRGEPFQPSNSLGVVDEPGDTPTLGTGGGNW